MKPYYKIYKKLSFLVLIIGLTLSFILTLAQAGSYYYQSAFAFGYFLGSSIKVALIAGVIFTFGLILEYLHYINNNVIRLDVHLNSEEMLKRNNHVENQNLDE